MYKEKETSFLTLCVVNFGLTATSMLETWTPAQSFASTGRCHEEFFSFLDRMVLFLSFFFGPKFLFHFFFDQGLSSAFDFSMGKELPRVNLIKCTM